MGPCQFQGEILPGKHQPVRTLTSHLDTSEPLPGKGHPVKTFTSASDVTTRTCIAFSLTGEILLGRHHLKFFKEKLLTGIKLNQCLEGETLKGLNYLTVLRTDSSRKNFTCKYRPNRIQCLP